MAKIIDLSIVVPAYNEERIIKNSLNKILKFLSNKMYSWEVVVSDDGSSDATPKIVRSFKSKKVKLVRDPLNQGKGGALKKGILASSGEYIIFMDADLSVPLTNIDLFLKVLQREGGVVIASRRVTGAEILIHQPWHRETMGRFFTLMSRIVTSTNISDFTCGFKGFTKKAAIDIFSKSLIKRWAYDSEILFLANKLGYTIKEMPISWKNRKDTRVRLKRIVFETFFDLLKLRYFDFVGKYDR